VDSGAVLWSDPGPMSSACPPVAREAGLTLSQVRIGLARTEEVEPARGLQAEAFSPAETALGRPRALREELRVVVVAHDGGPQVVSCLTLLEQPLCVRGAEMPVGGVRQVATRPDQQNQGYASALMRDTLRAMRRDGIAVSLLFPFSFRYYRKFGYELGGNYCQFWCRPNAIPAYREGKECRRAGAQDWKGLAELDRARAWNRTCTLLRSAERWAEVCRDPSLVVEVWCGPSGVEGYAVSTVARDSAGGRLLRILDLAAGTRAAWRGLLGRLAATDAESVEWFASATDLSVSGLLRSPAPLREGFKPRAIATVRPFFQFRIIHLEQALKAALPSFPAGSYRLALRIQDEVLPENGAVLALAGTAVGARLAAARPSDPVLEADVRVFSQIFCGYLSPTEAVSQGLAALSCPSGLEAAETLFPAGEPFIPELDRF